MKKVCAWCSSDMGESSAPPEGITHGICAACAARFFAVDHEARDLDEFLDSFDMPVVAVDGGMRVMAVNERTRELVGNALAPLPGARPGTVFCCRYAQLPGGCGETVHCSGCTIRAALVETYESGEPRIRVPACLHKHDTRLQLFITTEKVASGVLLRIDGMSEE